MTPAAPSMTAVVSPPASPADSDVNQGILSVLKGTSLGYWALLLLAVGTVTWAALCVLYQVYWGLGVAGYSHPVFWGVYTHPAFWGVYIVTFVFWIGIAHAGTLISAILSLFRSKWRAAINRSAEAMTIFAVLTAAQFLGVHVGRVW
jgi:molybdopterin-containing oxidoreductase family membrane subunit